MHRIRIVWSKRYSAVRGNAPAKDLTTGGARLLAPGCDTSTLSHTTGNVAAPHAPPSDAVSLPAKPERAQTQIRFGGGIGGVAAEERFARTDFKGFLVRPRGFEPLTFCSGVWRSRPILLIPGVV